jgi:hypothetical protein
MNVFKIDIGKFPLGIWIAFFALCLSLLGWLMQAYSLLNWESAVNLGLQNSSFTGDAVERSMANKEKGEALADMLWPLPLAIIAIVGLANKKFYGFVAAMMEFATCVYFPLFYTFQLWSTHMDTIIAANLLWLVPSFFGIFGLWSNRKIFPGN